MTEENVIVDLRSDTITKPTSQMRRTMAEAGVGDDVFGEDPTANALQEQVAELLGKEAALFVPSGTMANQIAIRAHTEPGDEIICEASGHSYLYETGGPAALSGCSCALIPGERGVFTGEQVKAALHPAGNPHFASSRLILVENTHNRGGGSIWPMDALGGVRGVAGEAGLAMHLDGARLLNACVATGNEATAYTQFFDSCSICFSKGLGAPVGSAVAGSNEFIDRARRFRKMFGGGMRQIGILAAAATYALDNHVERLAEDHSNAQRLGQAISELDGIDLDPAHVETNIVIFDLSDRIGPAEEFVQRMGEHGVLMLAIGPMRVRAVTSLAVDGAGIDRAIEFFRQVVR
jgi:threonine aldolase